MSAKGSCPWPARHRLHLPVQKDVLIYLLMCSGPARWLLTVSNVLNVCNRRGVMTLDVCIHFAGRGIAKVKLTSFSECLSLKMPKIKAAVAQLTTRQQKQSLPERTVGLNLIIHGDFIRILLLGGKWRWQEIVLKPTLKKKSFKIAV